MRNLLLTILSLLLLAACTNSALRNQHSQLAKADSLCSVQPDSALALLSQLEPEMQQADKATRMYYQLLCIKASDKAYITHTSDSLIQEVLQYYIRMNDRHHLPEAYYYAGRVCRDLGDAPQALDYFQKAIEYLNDSFENVKLKNKIYAQMGTLYSYQRMYNEALLCYKKSLACDKALSDTIGMILSLRDIAGEYWGLQKKDSVEYYYRKAYHLARISNKEDLVTMLSNQIAGFYAEMADYVQAKKYLIETDASNLYSRSAVYSISAKLYHNIGNLDSATYYYKKLLVEGTLYAKRIANKGLAQIAAHKGKPNEALIYYQSYELITDSIYAMQDAENIRQLAVVYDYQLREKENQRLKQRNYTQQITFLIIIIIAIVICSSMWLYSQYHRRKQMELNFQMERLSKIQKEQDLYNKKLIEENNIKISNIEKQLQTSNKENRNLIIQLEGQKEIIRKTNRLAQIEIERREHAKDLIVYTPIYQHIESLLQGKERIKKLMTEDDWNVLEDTINELYVGFIPRIRYLQEMSEFEFRICLLIKIGIKVSDMARLTNHSNESVSSVRRRLYEKIHKRKGTPKELDNFIISL